MRGFGLACLCAVMCVGVGSTAAKWDDTVAPLAIQAPASGGGVRYAYHMAHFGSIPYGEAIDGMRLLTIDPSCMCGDVPCNTGCGDFDLTTPACKPKVSRTAAPNNGGMVIVEETGGTVDRFCLRSDRAYNVARAGAQAVVIIPPRGSNSSELLIPPAVVTDSFTAQTDTLRLQHVNIPVGVVTYNAGQKLKKLSDTGNAKVGLDFRNVFTASNNVTISIWHNTGDDCGPPCYYLHQFFDEIADVSNTLVPDHPIRVTPRFTYDTCSPANSLLCEMSCTNGGRYCHRKIENEHLWGRLVAEENIRQACLFNVLRNTGNSDTRPFWQYKKWFQANCQNNARSFNQPCAEQAFKQTQNSDLFDQWRTCWSQSGAEVNGDLAIAERDLEGARAQQIADGMLATVVINDQHYRGELDAAHVMKAACSALTPALRNGLAVCQRFTQGTCSPGSEGDRVCGSARNFELNRSNCKEVGDSYRCECSPGYGERTLENGELECIDRNECLEFPTLCKRNADSRNSCQNTPGSFSCLFDSPNYCTPDEDFGECWRDQIGDALITSCEDMFPQFSANLQNGRQGGALSRCRCENIFGCYAGGDGDCVQKCDDPSNCNPNTGECTAGQSKKGRGRAVAAGFGITFAVLFGIALIAAGYYLYRKYGDQLSMPSFQMGRSPEIQDTSPGATTGGVVTEYPQFQDGLDADEMQNVGTVNPGEFGAGRTGAVAAVSAAQYAYSAGGTGGFDGEIADEHNES